MSLKKLSLFVFILLTFTACSLKKESQTEQITPPPTEAEAEKNSLADVDFFSQAVSKKDVKICEKILFDSVKKNCIAKISRDK